MTLHITANKKHIFIVTFINAISIVSEMRFNQETPFVNLIRASLNLCSMTTID